MHVDGLRGDPERLFEAARILERENLELAKQNLKLREQNARLAGQDTATLQLQIAELEQQLAVRNRLLFGDKSEKRPTPVNPSKQESKEKKPQTGHGPSEQPELEHIEEVKLLDEGDQSCPECGGELGQWDEQFEESEVIDVITRKFVVRQIKRQKYRCKCCTHIETALHDEPRLIEGGRYSNAFAVEVATDKYADHLPLERQVRRMKREGLQVTSQALWDQIHALAKVLEPTHQKLKEHMLTKAIVGADETHWKLLGRPRRKTKKWWVWALCSDESVYYELAGARSAEAAKPLLGDYQGIAMVDGYSAYASLKKQNPKLRLVHCWAHVRRKFIECEEHHPSESKKVLDWIGKLYALEREVNKLPAVQQIEQRIRIRDKQSRSITKEILAWSAELRLLPGSPLRKATEYMLRRWQGLTAFLSDPQIPLDNNHTERALRGVVVGRKNHYGSKSERGTKVAAILYSLLESAKLCHIDPREYLLQATRDALEGRDVPLPHQFAAQH